MKKRIILVILDGVGDKSYKQLDFKTPLEYANTKNLDFLASMSSCGLLWPIKGIAPESGVSQFVLLGYPLSLYPGRGILEALGAGIKIKKGFVYFRCNFARIKGRRIVNFREKLPSKKLIEKINKIDKDIKLFPTKEYRAILVVKGIKPNVSNTNPSYVRIGNFSKAVKPRPFKAKCKGDKKSCEKINSFVEKLEKLVPGKTILLRGASNKLPKLRKLKNWLFIGDMPIEFGIAKLLGMKILKVKGNAREKLKIALESRQNVYLQIKGPDEASHKGNVMEKVKEIEKIDKAFSIVKKAIKLKNSDFVLCITADHSTPCSLRVHSADPVPCLVYGKEKKDKVRHFNEKECKRGFRLEGKELMHYLKT